MTEVKDDRRFHNLTQEQVDTLDQVLTEVIPIHGRGNFPTLEIKPKDIIHVVRDRLICKNIKVRDVRLNGSTASHVLVKENGTSYKDLDIIFGVELPKQEDFQIIKEVVLSCLLDFLPQGVNKDKITALTMKEAYVQKMVKVFTEHDRWSLISLSNNSGKNVELKFVSSLRRQFEFSVDSFQIILDTMLESYLEAERREASQRKANEQDVSKIQSTQKGILHEQTTPAGMENHSEKDVDMTGETMDIPNVCECVCHSEIEMTEDQYKPSTEESKLEVIHEKETEELSQSITMPETAEEISQQSDTTRLTKPTDENSVNNFTCKEEMQEDNSNAVSAGSQVESEEVISEKNKDANESDPQLSTPQTNVPMKESKEAMEGMLATEAGHVKCTHEKEHADLTFEPMQTTEKNNEPMILTEQGPYLPLPPPITIHTQTSVDSNNEYPLPPPAKKTSRSSQMIVLKHSSPKPPRKMSKKVTCIPHSAEKSLSKDSTIKSCQHVNHSLNGGDLKESMPMQVELPSLTTNCFESLSSASHDNESLFRILDVSTPAFSVASQENGMHTKKTLSLSLSPEENVQTQVQTSEPETGETTNHSILSPLSKPSCFLKDQNIANQHFPEKVTKTSPQSVKPVIQVNSQSIVQVDDEPAPSLNSPCKAESDLAAQTAECAPEHSKPPDTATQTADSSSKSPTPLSTKVIIDSEEVENTTQGLVLPVISSQVPEPSISCLQPQEPPVSCAQTLESSVLRSHLLEPPILITPVQDPPVLPTDFLEPPEILSSVLEPPFSSSENQYCVQPSNALESSTLLSVGSESSVVSFQTLKPPERCPQIMELSKESLQTVHSSISPAKVPQSPIPLELETPIQTSQSLNASDTKNKELQPPTRGLPSVTVVAESMYGDFEQAMDHLRYRLIATRNPEEIRGGGLLKYSNLLVRDFKPASETEIKTLERYMCSRFFIDFPDVNEQQRKIESYLRNHFIGEEKSKYDYLMTLRRVVNESTVCLMGHERRQTLNMITILALKVLGEQNIIPNTNNVTCYYQPAPYMADHNFGNYYIASGQSPLIYHPYPLHIHMQTGLV